jgi:hypothetical protein
MLTLLGILFLVAGASLTFAVDREVDGLDVQMAGWILLAGGALAMIVAMIRAAGLAAVADREAEAAAGWQLTRADHEAAAHTDVAAERLDDAHDRDGPHHQERRAA